MKQGIYKEWLSNWEWDFFTTTTYENPNTSIKKIEDCFNDYFNNYWITQIVWCIEKTKNNNLPHVHCLIKTINKDKRELLFGFDLQ